MLMHIGNVARKIGLTPDAIRFYERNALLPRVPRSAGGFRQYADADVETLEIHPASPGPGIYAQRSPRAFGAAAPPVAAMRAGAPAIGTKTLARPREACGPSQLGARAAHHSARLQGRSTQTKRALPTLV